MPAAVIVSWARHFTQLIPSACVNRCVNEGEWFLTAKRFEHLERLGKLRLLPIHKNKYILYKIPGFKTEATIFVFSGGGINTDA